MRRLTAILLAVCVVAGAGRTNAEEPHEAWWKYLKGEWTYEIPELDIKADATWRVAAKGNAVVGRFTEGDEVVSIEVGGYRDDTKTMVVTGYSSRGTYWQLDLKFKTDAPEGLHYGTLPDGRPFEGEFKATKKDENQFEWKMVGKTGDGQPLTLSGKYERKTE
jgi:hypothetical protein